ncbi:aminotransferase class V-fold PLP-dependent enzyme [Dehalococcoidia bacterium]|nr:aminotransferase class V-fold PLP-dependent enzyme [Dehalococcoidia bacterium]
MIYLDNAATSWPKPEAVYQAMDGFMCQVGASPGRSGHRLSIEAGRVVYETRESLARLFNIDDPLRIIFTSNATEALNVAINGVLRPGDHAITSSMEHNSVMRPLRALQERGVELTVVSCSKEGFLDPGGIEKAIKPNTRLIVLNHASNVVGTLLPVIEVGAIARRHGVLFCIDAAQSAGAYPLDVSFMKVDLLAFTGHKSLYGPQGTGGLYIRQGVEDVVEPLMRGGTGSRSDSEHQPDFLPDKYESGTPNTVGLAGLGAGVQFVLSRGVNALREKEEKLMYLLIEGLGAIPGVTLYGSGDAREQVAVLSFNIAGIASSEVAMRLEEEYDILCRPGLQCAPIAHKTLGTFPGGTVRVSPGYFTTEYEVDIVLRAIRNIASMGKGIGL